MEIELLKLEIFLEELYKIWKIVKTSMKKIKEAIKNIQLNQFSKRLNQKRYKPFKITKNIRQEVF